MAKRSIVSQAKSKAKSYAKSEAKSIVKSEIKKAKVNKKAKIYSQPPRSNNKQKEYKKYLDTVYRPSMRLTEAVFGNPNKLLTPNQRAYLKEYNRLKHGLQKTSKVMHLDLSMADLESLLPVAPKKITKTYLKKLAKKTAVELLAGLMGENPIAKEVAEVVVDVVAENVTPADDENVSRETSDSTPYVTEDIPSIGVVEALGNKILSLPDYLDFYSKRLHHWVRYPLEDDKKELLDLFSYNDWYSLSREEQAEIVDRLMRHQVAIATNLDHVPSCSTQDDYNVTYSRIASLLTSDILDKGLATKTSNLTEKLGVY